MHRYVHARVFWGKNELPPKLGFIHDLSLFAQAWQMVVLVRAYHSSTP